MFLAEMFEATATIKKLVVIIPGGYHPFHTGHLSLYKAAQKDFPNADIYYAATDDRKERPFPFEIKKKLAQVAGVDPAHFIQVKSPFQAKEILQNYDPNTTAAIWVRSVKDQTEQPIPGGTKKDGSPAYFQPLTKNLAPLITTGYMAYLPTIEFKAGSTGITSATQIRNQWPRANNASKVQIVQDLYPRATNNKKLIAQIIGWLNSALTEGIVAETLKQVNGKWALVSKSTGKPLQYYKGSGRPSKEWVSKVERRVHAFKGS